MNGRVRRDDLLLLALILSLAVHVGLMFYARPRVMTHVVPATVRASHRGPMNMVRARPPAEDTVHMDVVKDVEPERQEPEAEKSEKPVSTSDAGRPELEREVLKVPESAGAVPTLEPPPDVKMEAIAQTALPKPSAATAIPSVEMALPKPGTALVAPDFGVGGGSLVGTAPQVDIPMPTFGEPKQLQAAAAPLPVMGVETPPPTFKPAEEVYEKVEEKVVEQEKAAVRDLLSAGTSIDLKPFVNAQVVATTSGAWTYFKVMLVPRQTLQTVPKDLVILLDASGSIGKERMNSIRQAAKELMRSGTNSGDRFNLVAFRDRYSYAFKAWQACDRTSFERADAWLDNVAAHGRTDVFSTISSVLTLPRDPTRPLIALVVTDGDANTGVSGTAEIVSRFTALNDGLISVYMYGVKSSANRELIDLLTRGNRGESFIYSGWRWGAGSGIEGLSERFRDPVLSDLRVIFAAGCPAEAYPRRLRNIYRGGLLELYGRVPQGTREVAFSVRGLNGREAYEGFFRLPLTATPGQEDLAKAWQDESRIDAQLGK